MTLSVNIPNVSPIYLDDVIAKVSDYANSYVMSLQGAIPPTKTRVPHHTSERLKALKLHSSVVIPNNVRMEDIYEC